MKRLVTVLTLALASSATTARAQDADKEKPGPTSTSSSPPSSPLGATDGTVAIEQHYPPPSTRLKLIGAGLVVTAAAWGVSFAAARGWPEQPCVITDAGSVYANSITPCVSGPPGAAKLQIPIVGPWLALGVSGCPNDAPTTCNAAGPILRGVAYVLDGVAQIGGIALVAEALIMKTESAVDTKKTSPLALRAGGFELKPLPIITPTMSGVSLTGTF